MKILDVFAYSFSAIKLRKLRAALTTLGVVIGIAAIVALLSITQGLQATITDQLERGLAADTLIVIPGSSALGGGAGEGGGFGGGEGFGGGSTRALLYINYTSQINSLSPNIVTSLAVIQKSGYIQNGSGITRPVTSIVGVDFAQFANAFPTTFVAASGSIPTNPADNDIVVGARVSYPRLNGTLFVQAGQDVTLIWTNNTVIPFVNETYTAHISAVLDRIGGFGLGGPSDTSVYMPLSQAEKFFGTDEADMIIVKLKSSDLDVVNSTSTTITNYFGNQVSVISATAVQSLLSTIFSTVSLFLGGIAAISLLVAGIGIMNIMIVSLIERTREIGILKALGMKSRTVLHIFLTESIIIGLMGAIIGIASGWVLANVVALFLGRGGIIGSALTITPILRPEVMLGALGFGVGISVIFALYPAWRASKLKPVEALRYE
ncbi:ABC transporter permease [Candidatus Bathyarchaeota archaeon A05DMB-2]|jgi:putative ABC transport system permease protein|nr:ABC transporter permease [Candidatus Bathyarchaeota archaeon A05DMB-2]